MKRLAVIGGGMSGLTAAYQGQLQGAEVHLFEASPRLGGAIKTVRDEHGLLYEAGADSILNEKPWARELADELGLGPQIVSTRPEHRHTYIVRSGKLCSVPEGFRLMAPQEVWPFLRSPILSWPGKLRVAMDLVVPRRRGQEDESLASFVRRRLGRECLERLAQPMVGGIYAADPERLSMQATMPAFVEMEAHYGSILRGLWARRTAAQGPRYALFINFKEGTQTLLDALAARLSKIHLDRPVAELRPEGSGWSVDGEAFDAVVVAMPTHRAAPLVRPFEPLLAQELEAIPYSSAATVNLVYPESVLGHRSAYGFVVPAIEGMSLMACTFSHLKWPGRAPQGKALLRGYLGGAHDEGVVERTDQELIWIVRRELQRLLGISQEPLLEPVVERLRRAMPLYQVGHLQRVERIETLVAKHPGLGLAGNGFRGVGIPDVVRRAREVVRRLPLGD